jgi:tRNA (guanine-N7-)-methyltransferase
MGRRALPKIDPSLDVGARLRSFDQLPRPWDAAALFGRVAPLEIEVGSGKGLFLRSAATAWPAVDFLGIEVAQKYARFAAAGLVKRGLTNAMVVAGDALRVFAELLPDASIEAVHVYFPDPWWKKRHRRRRVVRDSFVRDVQRVLRPGGRFHLWSDVEEYFRTSLDVIAAETTLSGPMEEPELPAEHDMDYRTHFERRMRLNGEPVYRTRFVKR